MAKGANNKKNAASLFFEAVGNGFKEIGATFAEGDIKTKLSYLIFGLGPILRGQILIGVALLLCEVLFFYFMIGFGWQYLSKFSTLGTIATKKVGRKTVYGDNSFLILLFGVLCIFAIIAFIAIWYINVKENRKEELLLKAGKKLPSNKDVFLSLFDKNFHKTLLALPVTGIFVFTVLPIVFMILVAFTNYDGTHNGYTNSLFTWVGLDNFNTMLSWSGGAGGTQSYAATFGEVLLWTLIWAFFATFTN